MDDFVEVGGPPFDERGLTGKKVITCLIPSQVVPFDDPVVGESFPPQSVQGYRDLLISEVEDMAVAVNELCCPVEVHSPFVAVGEKEGS